MMSTSTIIAIIEGIALFIIFFRWARKPLTPEQIAEKERKKLQKEQEWELQVKIWQDQEETIKNLKKPVLFVDVSGNYDDGRSISVQDGDGNHHVFSIEDNNLIKKFPYFNSLLGTVLAPNMYVRCQRGDVILK